MEYWVETTCELSHQVNNLLGVPVIHGHSYWIRVYAESDGTYSANSFKAQLLRCVRKIDHSNMNDKISCGTMEGLAKWIAENLQFKGVTRIQIERKSLGYGVELVL